MRKRRPGAGRKPLMINGEIRTVGLNIRFTESENDQLTQEAASLGITKADLIRLKLRNPLQVSQNVQKVNSPTDSPPGEGDKRSINPPDEDQIFEKIEELKKLIRVQKTPDSRKPRIRKTTQEKLPKNKAA